MLLRGLLLAAAASSQPDRDALPTVPLLLCSPETVSLPAAFVSFTAVNLPQFTQPNPFHFSHRMDCTSGVTAVRKIAQQPVKTGQ